MSSVSLQLHYKNTKAQRNTKNYTYLYKNKKITFSYINKLNFSVSNIKILFAHNYMLLRCVY